MQSVILAHFLYFFFSQLLVSGLQYVALMPEVGKVRKFKPFWWDSYWQGTDAQERPGWKFAASLDPQPPKKMHYPERGSISVSGQQSTYPSPNPTFTLTCWVRGGVCGPSPRYWYWSLKDIKIYGKKEEREHLLPMTPMIGSLKFL